MNIEVGEKISIVYDFTDKSRDELKKMVEDMMTSSEPFEKFLSENVELLRDGMLKWLAREIQHDEYKTIKTLLEIIKGVKQGRIQGEVVVEDIGPFGSVFLTVAEPDLFRWIIGNSEPFTLFMPKEEVLLFKEFVYEMLRKLKEKRIVPIELHFKGDSCNFCITLFEHVRLVELDCEQIIMQGRKKRYYLTLKLHWIFNSEDILTKWKKIYE